MWFLLALALAADASTFAGSWVLDAAASDNADAVLAAFGVSWMERQAARTVTPVQTITVNGNVLTLVVDASVTTRTETMVLDGSAQQSTSSTGKPVTTRTSWQGAALVSRTETVGPDGQPLTLVTTRTVEQGGAVMRQRIVLTQADGKVLQADRVFKRKG